MAWLELSFIDMEVTVDAPVETVFAFLLDVERWPSWASGVRRAFRKSDGPWGTGAQFGFVPDFLPVPMVARVLAYEENRLVEWGVRAPGFSVAHRFAFQPAGEGRCRVVQTESAGGLAALLMRPLRGRIESFDRRMARDLQTAVSRGAGPA